MNSLKNFIQELELPSKDKFKLSEVVAISKLQERVLKYWEKEFNFLIGEIQGVFYSKKQMLIILSIKELLVIQRKDKESVKTNILDSMYLIENKFNGVSKENSIKKEKKTIIPDNQKIYSEIKSIRSGLCDILKILEK